MAADPTVIVLGEDVVGGAGQKEDAWGGVMGATKGLIGKYGAGRVIDTPISETGLVGMAVGAATTGLRHVSIAVITSGRGGGCDGLPNSEMSAPAKKVRPAQAMTSAFARSSAAPTAIASASPARTGWASALTGGLSAVTTSTSS